MDKISTIKENILYFIEKQNISKVKFYEKTKLSASNFKGLGLNSEIGGDKIVRILDCYPEINPEWILTGKGDMLRDSSPKSEQYTDLENLLNSIIHTQGEMITSQQEIIKTLQEKLKLIQDKK
jgi:hypothetical protein